MVLMVSRIQIAESVFIDARSVPIAVITLFEGWPTGVVAVVPPIVYRLWQGGPGAPAGVALLVGVLIVAGLIHLWTRHDARLGVRHAAALGTGVFLVTLGAFALLGRRGLQLFDAVWLPYAAVYAVGIGVITRLFHDVAQRGRLAAERERFRAIIDAASDAIRIVDPATMRIVDCNRADCALSGYERDDMIGRDVRQFWPSEPELEAQRDAELAEVHARGIAERFGSPYRTRSGDIVKIDSTRRLVDHEGRRYEIVVFRNAADREAAESARREASELRAVNLLANAAAHEINNPLAVVVASLELLARQVPAESRESHLIAQARTAGDRIRDIVIRMRRIIRIEADAPSGMVPPFLDLRKSSDPNRAESVNVEVEDARTREP